ncbi:MAG: DUF1513 domain-containing protein [Parvibaculaceae bacterium]
MQTRRDFLATGTALAGTALLSGPALTADRSATWVGCRTHNGVYAATLFDGRGTILWDVVLPGRGHDVVASSDGEMIVAVARRPGTFAFVIDTATGEILHEIGAGPDRHFYGHGCFSPDGRLFYTTENDLLSDGGMIGVRDVGNGFSRVASFPTGGIGPHELAFLPDGNTLAVANGGILTRPETGRTKLNTDTMSPSLALIDAQTGTILSEHRLPKAQHQLSIRHMSVGAPGIALALQYEGPKTDRMPLLALFDGTALRLAETPSDLAREMRNYAGSIAHDRSGTIIAMSSPRGSLVSFWDAAEGTFLGSQSAFDICGLAPGDRVGEFVATGGKDALIVSADTLASDASFADTQWDNHLLRIA